MNRWHAAVFIDGRLRAVDGGNVGALFKVVMRHIDLGLREHIDGVAHSQSGVFCVLGVGKAVEEVFEGVKGFFGRFLIALREVLLGDGR